MFDRFLDYLRQCQGCIGTREDVNCGYKLTCAYVERLAKRGEIRSAVELRKLGGSNA